MLRHCRHCEQVAICKSSSLITAGSYSYNPDAIIPPPVLHDLAAIADLFMKITMRGSRPFICSHRSGRIYTGGVYTPRSTSAANDDDAAGAGDGGGGAGDGAGSEAGGGAGSEAGGGATGHTGLYLAVDPGATRGLFIVGELIPFDGVETREGRLADPAEVNANWWRMLPPLSQKGRLTPLRVVDVHYLLPVVQSEDSLVLRKSPLFFLVEQPNNQYQSHGPQSQATWT